MPQESIHTEGGGVSYNLSELFERVADFVPGAPAMVTVQRRLTYAELERRANSLAHHLAASGIGPGDHVGLHLQNGTEYIEGMLACFKLRAVPININYRYVERELEYLYNHTDVVALIFHRQYAALVQNVAPAVSTLKHLLEVADDSGSPTHGVAQYEDVLAAASPTRDFAGRSSDDLYCACTGGTTGLPKGVLWRHEDLFFATMGGGDPSGYLGAITAPEQLVERVFQPGLVQLVTPPLMHVSAHWAAFQALFGGGTLVLTSPGTYDPREVWRLIRDQGVHIVTLVGDAMMRPLLEEIRNEPAPGIPLGVMASGGALVSPATKALAHELMPNLMVVDGFGSTETGITGTDRKQGSERSAFTMDDTTAVLRDDLTKVVAGSGEVGRLARTGRIPIGYLKDQEKTAQTFVVKDGTRWVLPGDQATVEADGSIVLLGRGSTSINTGGEKVFPEEVESALVGHPAIADVLVVGVPDEKWGQRVVAVVELVKDRRLDLEAVKAHCRDHLAGYKIPRGLVEVPKVLRNPNGKADYLWAKEQALRGSRD